MGKTWSQKEIEILQDFYGKVKRSEIFSLLPGRTDNSIYLKANSLNLHNNKSDNKRKFPINDNFFDVPNEINCYWAGFIAADGNIGKIKNSIAIKLCEKDKSHLDLFARDVEFGGNYKTFKKGKGFGNPDALVVAITITSARWKEKLKEIWSIVPNKTRSLCAPNLKEKSHIASYIAGYIDGDGCIYMSTPKHRTPSVKLLGTWNICQFIKGFVDSNFPNKKPSNISKSISQYVFIYGFSNSRLMGFYNYIKQLSLPLLYRKWKLCEESHFLTTSSNPLDNYYDYLIVGAGLAGSTFAYEASRQDKKVLVVDKRPNIGGNMFNEMKEGINIHSFRSPHLAL